MEGGHRQPLRLHHVLVALGLLLAVGIGVSLLLRDEGRPHHPPSSSSAGPPPAPATPPPPPVAAPAHHAAVHNGRLVVDGTPFFPIMSWGECVDGFETSLPVGTNLYAANRCGGLEAQLPTLAGRALSAGVAGEAVPSDGAVIGVFYPDEPDGHGLTGKTMPTIEPNAGVRFLTLTNHFYSGAAPLAQGRAIYPGLIAKADMVGFDLYPLQIWCRPERLVDVYFAQRELASLAKGKPTFQWIEAAGMDCPHGGTAVTPATVRAESWLAIAGGARGLGFFPPAAWTGDVGEAIRNVTTTVRELGPALLGPDASVGVEPSTGLVKAGARAFDGRLYVIAANAGYTAAQARISVPGLGGRTLEVLGEDRQIVPEGETFSERFPPLAARVYVAEPVG